MTTKMTASKRWNLKSRLATVLLLSCLGAGLWVSLPAFAAQSSATQQPQTPAQSQTTGQPSNDIPDAPTVQPSSETPQPPPPPVAKPEEKKPVERDPWTNQPLTKPAAPGSNDQPDAGTGDAGTPPPMPPVKTLPPGSSAKGPTGQEQLYKLKVTSNFVQVPVTVKDHDGRRVDGLLSTDFTVKENGTAQKLSFFTADPFGLSVAIVLDTGMSDAELQKVNQTFSALAGAFAPYDEVALYTYSSTVSEVNDFSAVTPKLTALLNQIKTQRGANDGVPVMSGPMAPNGPIINGVPLGSPTEPVYTPPRESHVLNDAILQAALDLRKRDRTRRKIIFVISDGRELGSKASYNDVKRVLLTNEIQVEAVSVGNSALPVYDKLEKFHIPFQGYDDLMPKYAVATGGSEYRELTRSSIEEVYAQVMSEARSQYTLGYSPSTPKTQSATLYRSIEVVVHRPGLKIYAKDGYYPAQAR